MDNDEAEYSNEVSAYSGPSTLTIEEMKKKCRGRSMVARLWVIGGILLILILLLAEQISGVIFPFALFWLVYMCFAFRATCRAELCSMALKQMKAKKS